MRARSESPFMLLPASPPIRFEQGLSGRDESTLFQAVDDVEDLEQVAVGGAVGRILPHVLEEQDAVLVDDENAGDVLVHLAPAPLGPEEVEPLRKRPVGVDEDGERIQDLALLQAEVAGEELAVALHPAPARFVELGRVGGELDVVDLLELFGQGLEPGLDRRPVVGEDEEDLDVVLLADPLRLLEVGQLGVAVIADRAPVVGGRVAAREDDHHVLAPELRKRDLAALEGREGKVRHGLFDDGRPGLRGLGLGRGLGLRGLGGGLRAGQGQEQSRGRDDRSGGFQSGHADASLRRMPSIKDDRAEKGKAAAGADISVPEIPKSSMIEGMKNHARHRLAAFSAFLATALGLALLVLPAQVRPQQTPAAVQPDKYPLDAKIPVDSKITVGELANGLRYYIRENREPKDRAELRLVVDAGSVLEDEDQRGLAHMVEHMAFNGSKHFARQKLVDFMESIGMHFGPDLNAYTGFDETVYMLKIPTDSPEIIRTALLILEDWAHNLTFDEKAIEKERGVITEEWRLGQGAEARMRDKQFPVLFRGSRYAERQPIGKKEIIETFKPETLKRFYRTWYRPDLMAVIAVGDFDRARMEELVKKQLSGIPRDPGAPPRPVYPVPDHDGTLFAIATDKEASRSTVAVYHLLPLRDQSTVGAYRQRTVEILFNAMLNNRLDEIAQKPDPPFIGAGASEQRFVASKEVFALSALVPEGGIARGLRALYTEGERVARFGFTETEFERQKKDIMRFYDRALAQKDAEDSGEFADEFTRAFLEGEPVPGIEYEQKLQSYFMPGITLAEVNRLAGEWMTERNRVVMVNAPDKPGVKVPDAAELQAALDGVKHEEIAPYVDTVSQAPLMAQLPEPGEVVSTRTVEAAGITEWKLANGVRVVLKPTNFKEDEILLRATSPGGISLATDENLVPANTADDVVSSGGVDGFSAVELQKKLAGKAVSLTPTIGELEEGFTGSASPQDEEILFQMIYLMFTEPRPDPAVFESIKAQLKAVLENRAKNPEVVFSDTVRRTMQRDQPRFRPMTVDDIGRMDLAKSLAFYKDRFADASDFTFIFVGNLDLEKIRPLACRYLGSLPSLNRKETWKDWRVPPPDGVVKRKVVKGLEPKSLEAIVFSGGFCDSAANRLALRAAAQVLETRLRKTLREKLGETYEVSVEPYASEIPRQEYRLMIDLGADPRRIDGMTKVIFGEVKKLKDKGPTDRELADVRTAEARDYETNVRENGWWLDELAERYRLGQDPAEALKFPETLAGLSKKEVQDAARIYLNTKRYVQVTLYPEKTATAPSR